MTPVYDFTWKGLSAFEDYGIDTLSVGSVSIAERRDTTSVVSGKSGLVHSQDGAVEEVDYTLTIYLPYTQGRTVADVREIRSWLKGYGAFTLSTVSDRYMMAYITDLISLDPVVDGVDDLKGTVTFRCEPFLYHTDAEEEEFTEAGVISNPGDADSEPYITLDATGDVDLMIGTQTILFTDLTDPVVLDCAAQECFSVASDGTYTNCNNLMSGDFPVLEPGDNAVSWSLGEDAQFNSLTILPRWRDEH